MTGPKGNSEFCFPEALKTLNVSRGEVDCWQSVFLEISVVYYAFFPTRPYDPVSHSSLHDQRNLRSREKTGCQQTRGEAEGNIEVEGKQSSLFFAEPVIKCCVIPLNSKLEKPAKKSFALRRLAHKFVTVSRSTT